MGPLKLKVAYIGTPLYTSIQNRPVFLQPTSQLYCQNKKVRKHFLHNPSHCSELWHTGLIWKHVEYHPAKVPYSATPGSPNSSWTLDSVHKQSSDHLLLEGAYFTFHSYFYLLQAFRSEGDLDLRQKCLRVPTTVHPAWGSGRERVHSQGLYLRLLKSWQMCAQYVMHIK